jgi:hypothetical protein
MTEPRGRDGSQARRWLSLAPRVAAIALVAQALLMRWADSSTSLAMPLRTAAYLAIAALGVAQLVSLATLALHVLPRWATAGLAAWAVGWLSLTLDTSVLIRWSLGAPFPMVRHQLGCDPELIQLVATAGGLALGAALIAAIRDRRFRHSAIVLLVGHAAFGVSAAVTEYRLELATDFPTIASLRADRELADVIAAVALAGVLWLYWRHVARRRSDRDSSERSP